MKKSLLFLLLVLLASVPAYGFELTVLHVNDTHSYLAGASGKLKVLGAPAYATLGGWARLATEVEAVRGEKGNVALLHAGDAVQGDLYFMKYGGRPEMELLDRLGFDAFVLGNHEFDRGAEFLAKLLTHTDVPVLSANVDASGVPDLAEKVRFFTLLDYDGESVAVVGLTLAETRFVSSPGPGISFHDEIETAKRVVRSLEERGINKIILLTHVGLDFDKRLAAEVPGVDLIVGGHSHTLLGKSGNADFTPFGLRAEGPYPVKVNGPDGQPVYIVTAWKWSQVLGRLDVSFDDDGRIVKTSASPQLVVAPENIKRKVNGEKIRLAKKEEERIATWLDANPPAAAVVRDREIAAYLAPFSQGVANMRKDIIGTAATSLPHISVPGVLPDGVSLPNGSLLAPLVAESMLLKLASTGSAATIALQNGGGVRSSLSAGNISMGDVYTLLPFRNPLYVLNVTGGTLKDALEHGVSKGGGAFLYMAGARYAADMTRPEGSRIVSVDVQFNGKWQPLSDTETYRVVTNSYLAKGGDGYSMLAELHGYNTGFIDTMAFIEYVKRRVTLRRPKSTGVQYTPGS